MRNKTDIINKDSETQHSRAPSEQPEQMMAKKEWYDVKPSFNLSKLLERLLEASQSKDRKECVRCLLGLHIRFWHASVPDMAILLMQGDCWNTFIAKILTVIPKACKDCRDFQPPATKPQV
eukprot:2643060-Pyramimonas_sp.AAC.1